jgi:hypothetical protein
MVMDLPESSGDGHHYAGDHQDHPGTDHGTKVDLNPCNASLVENRSERSEEA